MKTNDIQIGENKWIRWIEPDFASEGIDIDELLKPTAEWWTRLEANCVVDCCGFDAYCFLPETIKKASEIISVTEIKQELLRLIETVEKINSKTLESDVLCCIIHKKVFIELLKHIIAHMD